MRDVRVPPAPGLPRGLNIPAAELTEVFSHASGPGGQGVNTSDSRVQLSYDVGASATLSERQRERALRALAPRLVGGVLTVSASEQRSQVRNRAAARERLAALLREALAPEPPQRRATKPTRGSQRRRLEAKRQRADVKRARRRPGTD